MAQWETTNGTANGTDNGTAKGRWATHGVTNGTTIGTTIGTTNGGTNGTDQTSVPTEVKQPEEVNQTPLGQLAQTTGQTTLAMEAEIRKQHEDARWKTC